MPDNSKLSRRDIFQILGSAPVAAAVAGSALAQDHDHMRPAVQQAAGAGGPYKRKVFDDHQWRTVHVLWI